jgi:signal transduction histidine kinase
LSNAVKFTEGGTISIAVKMLEHIEEQISLEFSITDTGIGIPEKKQNQLFESYTQAEKSTTRTHGGTGISLNI